MKKLLFKIAVWLLRKRLINSTGRLTKEDLEAAGWIKMTNDHIGTYYCEANIKDRDRVAITFENHYYRVWHGKGFTFIALESTKEWLQVYLLLMDKHGKVTI